MLLEGLLAVVTLTIGYNIYRTKKVQGRVNLLEAQNDNLTEALMLPPSSIDSKPYVPHEWVYVTEETVHYNIFSMDSVRTRVEKCTRCGLLHRFIINGYTLAKSKGMTDIEGFYNNGMKCADVGCKHDPYINI